MVSLSSSSARLRGFMVVAVFLLVLAAVGSAVAVHRLNGRAVSPPPEDTSGTPTHAEDPQPRAVEDRRVWVADPRVEELQKRLAAMEERQAPSAAPTTTPEEGLARIRARHQETIAEHKRQAADPTFAREMSKTIDGALRGLAEGGEFRIADIDCRNTSCIATVEWPSFAVATQRWNKLLEASYGACGVNVALDDGAATTGAFQTQVVFDCPKNSEPSTQ
jgi:hypothetical protein